MGRSLGSVRSRVNRLAQAVEASVRSSMPRPDLWVLTHDELVDLERLLLKRDGAESFTEEDGKALSELVSKCQRVA